MFSPIRYLCLGTPPKRLGQTKLFQTAVYLEAKKHSQTYFAGACASRGPDLYGETELFLVSYVNGKLIYD